MEKLKQGFNQPRSGEMFIELGFLLLSPIGAKCLSISLQSERVLFIRLMVYRHFVPTALIHLKNHF
jgi:hypothetical protein